MLIVQKFGGSSLAEAGKLRKAAEICVEARRRGNDVVLVVSARGDTTDELLDMAYEVSSAPSSRELDVLLSTGELQSAALMAIMLESMGVKARSFSGAQAGIHTESAYGNARIESVDTGRIKAALDAGEVAVVSGFQGVDSEGDTNTLGRGGSDTTAVALAAALDANRCEIYTDVNGIYTADPRLISEAKLLDEIDFRDMLKLAQAGSQVLHSRSVQTAMKNGIEIRLLSTFDGGAGSAVRALRDEERADYVGVTRNAQSSEVSLVGKCAGADTLSELVLTLSRAGIPALSVSSEEGCATVKVSPSQLSATMNLIHATMIK